MINSILRPLNHKVLVEERSFADKTKGGILLPQDKVEQYQSAVCEGLIVDMAKDAFDYYTDDDRPKIGEIVHFPKFEGILRKYNNKNYRLIHDETIYAESNKYLEKEDEIIHGN